MGRRGPAPTPSPILKLRGTFRKDRNRSEPQPEQSAPPCPEYLEEPAKAVWNELLPQLQATGVLSRIDANALARYCTYFARWRKAEAFLAKNGDVYPLKDGNGKVKCLQPFPQVSIASKLGALLTRLEQEFGLTPSSRTRIQSALPAPTSDEDDELEQLLRSA